MMQVLSSGSAPTSASQTAQLIATIVPRLNRALRGQARPAAGLSMPQFITLRALRHGPLSAGQLAQRFGVSRPTITRMVDGLVKKGLVERHVGVADRRVALTTLTPSGRQMLEAFEERATRSIAELLATMPPDRLARLDDALADLADLLEESHLTGV
jgi:DNA-binding MarR family transcriptional regulator